MNVRRNLMGISQQNALELALTLTWKKLEIPERFQVFSVKSLHITRQNRADFDFIGSNWMKINIY